MVPVLDRKGVPVKITIGGGARTLSIASYRDWNSSAVHFPPGTPAGA